MLFNFQCVLLSFCFFSAWSFRPSVTRSFNNKLQHSLSSSLSHSKNQESNSDLTSMSFIPIKKAVSVLLLPMLFLGNPISFLVGRTDLVGIQAVHAEFRAQQKKTYFRLIPKFTTGLDYYISDLKTAVDNEDWDKITKFFEVYVAKYNKNDPSQVDATDTYVNNHYYRPMTVFAGTFAERGTSPKQKALVEQEVAFEKAMFLLEGTVKVQKEEGFFGKDIPIPEGSARKQQAQEAWAKGKQALSEYVRIANAGLNFELNKIKQI